MSDSDRNKRCSVDGCIDYARNVTPPLYCEVHYCRLRRTGTTDKPTIAKFKKNDRGYVLVYEPDHPLAGGKEDNYVYEHRQVLHDALGGIPPVRCEWCLTDLDGWSAVHVDHLDFDRANNAPENLIASCAGCNRRRMPHGDPDGFADGTAARIVLARHWSELAEQVQRIRGMLPKDGPVAQPRSRALGFEKSMQRTVRKLREKRPEDMKPRQPKPSRASGWTCTAVKVWGPDKGRRCQRQVAEGVEYCWAHDPLLKGDVEDSLRKARASKSQDVAA